MSSIIDRMQSKPDHDTSDARVVTFADGDADRMLEALGTETRREIVKQLFEEPSTTSELADELDSSVQNIHQHLGRLEDAELVTAVDTVYSEKGAEMRLYAPAHDPLVFVGEERRERQVRTSLRELLVGAGLLAGATVLVQVGAERLVASGSTTAPGIGPLSHPAGGTGPALVFEWVVFGLLEPGIVFLLACLTFLVALVFFDV